MAYFTDKNQYVESSFAVREGISNLKFDLMMGPSRDRHYLKIRLEVGGHTDTIMIRGQDLDRLHDKMWDFSYRIEQQTTFRTKISARTELQRHCSYDGIWETSIVEIRPFFDIPNTPPVSVRLYMPFTSRQYKKLRDQLPRMMRKVEEAPLPRIDSYSIPVFKRECLTSKIVHYFATEEEACRDPYTRLHFISRQDVINCISDNTLLEPDWQIAAFEKLVQHHQALQDHTREEEEEEALDAQRYAPWTARASTPDTDPPRPLSPTNLLNEIDLDRLSPPPPPRPLRPTHKLTEIAVPRPSPYDLCYSVIKRLFSLMIQRLASSRPERYCTFTADSAMDVLLLNRLHIQSLLNDMLDALNFTLNTPTEDFMTLMLQSTDELSPYTAGLFDLKNLTCDTEEMSHKNSVMDAMFEKFVGCYYRRYKLHIID